MDTTSTGNRVHKIKSDSPSFQAIVDGDKTFEARLNDRDYRLGDYLLLQEWYPSTQEYSGRGVVKRVTYILRGGQYGVEDGYVVMSLDPRQYTLAANHDFSL